MFSAILTLLLLPFVELARSRGIQFRPSNKVVFFAFVAVFLLLMQLGAKHVESPFIEFGQLSTGVYFIYFLVTILLINLLHNTLIIVSRKTSVPVAMGFMPFTYLHDSISYDGSYAIIGIIVVALLLLVLCMMISRYVGKTTHKIHTLPVPGRRCPSCLERGDTV
jgi:hypothetical protein